jgi:pimeloyl-ACP methyl ester carboxylesterase
MQTVISADGTQIAFDRYGEGPPVIVVHGALGFRRFKASEQLATALAEHCTVINYDRRGRGDSGPAGPVSVEREVEDVAALIDAAAGRAALFGLSSGGALALRAAGADIGVDKLVVYETPFKTDPTAKYPRDDYGVRLDEIVAARDRAGAARHFMRNAVGMPAPLVAVMSRTSMFKQFAANGLTLTFDYAALGEDNMHGAPLRAQEWVGVTCPTLVVYGGKTYGGLKHASRALAEVLSDATLRELPGQRHNVAASAIVPVLAEFVVDGASVAAS